MSEFQASCKVRPWLLKRSGAYFVGRYINGLDVHVIAP